MNNKKRASRPEDIDEDIIQVLSLQGEEEPPRVVKVDPAIEELKEKIRSLEDLIRDTDMEIRAALLQIVASYNRRYNLGRRRDPRRGGGAELSLEQFRVPIEEAERND